MSRRTRVALLLLLLLQLGVCLVSGSLPRANADQDDDAEEEEKEKLGCGIDRIGFLWSAVGGGGFWLEEGKRRKRRTGAGDDAIAAGGLVAACEALESYSRNGCLACDPRKDEFAKIGRAFCGLELELELELELQLQLQLQLQLDARTKESKDCFSGTVKVEERKNQSLGQEMDDTLCLTTDHVMLSFTGAFLFCCSLICPCFRSKRRDLSEDPVLGSNDSLHSISSFELRSTSDRIPGSPLHIPSSPSRFSLSPQPAAVGHLNLSLPQIIKLTRNFSRPLIVGEGVFGTVYKAELPNGQVIAIKRAKKEHFAALQTEFSNEVNLLTKIEHRNLVRLLGYIDKDNERIIITEYVPNGTLREHLDGTRGKVLSFSQRLEIAIDIAHGLTYLHLYAERTIIHRDVKSKNILLTEGLRAKVADFGFARTGPLEGDQTHVETRVKGTAGYVDPEYLKTYKLTPKSDVYSYGILLLEILSARRPIEMHRSADERITVIWAFNKYNEGNERVILDPQMREAVNEKVLQNIFALAFQCVAPTRRDRPAMKEVVEKLWEIRKDYAKLRQIV